MIDLTKADYKGPYTLKVPLLKTIRALIIIGTLILGPSTGYSQSVKKTNQGSYIEYPQIRNLKKVKNEYYIDKARNKYQLYIDSRGKYYLKPLPQRSTYYTNRYTKVYIKNK